MEKHQFKPFDQVLARDEEDDIWVTNIFSHYSSNENYPYHCIDSRYRQCLPYNENTAHLIGTSANYELEQPNEWEVRSSNGLFVKKFTSNGLKKFIETAVIHNKDITNFSITHVF